MPNGVHKDPKYGVKWARNFRKNHPEEWKKRQSLHYQKFKAKIAARSKARRLRIQGTKEYKEYRRKEWMKNKYGITPEQYNEMHAAQEGVCGICEKEEITRWRRLAVDHDHQTGEIRGLLCFKCNMMLAYFEDSDWHKRATQYLGKARK